MTNVSRDVVALLCGVGLVVGIGSSAFGQVLPPAPREVRERERFETPPAPPMRPSPVAEEQPQRQSAVTPPAPDLIRRDEAGRLIRLEVPAEEAAILAMAFDDETMSAVLRGLEARRVEMEQKVFTNLDLLVEALMIVEVRSFDTEVTMELMQEGAQRASVFTTDSLLDALQRGGVISARARPRAKSGAGAYSRALTSDAARAFDANAGDWDNITRTAFRTTMGNLLAEATHTLDGLLHDAREMGVLDRLLDRDISGLTADGLRRAFLTELNEDQRRDVLCAARPTINPGC